MNERQSQKHQRQRERQSQPEASPTPEVREEGANAGMKLTSFALSSAHPVGGRKRARTNHKQRNNRELIATTLPELTPSKSAMQQHRGAIRAFKS